MTTTMTAYVSTSRIIVKDARGQFVYSVANRFKCLGYAAYVANMVAECNGTQLTNADAIAAIFTKELATNRDATMAAIWAQTAFNDRWNGYRGRGCRKH